MMTYRNICIKAYLLVAVVALSILNVNAQEQSLVNFANKYREELAEKQKAEKQDFEKACASNSIRELKSFISKYPKSKYIKDANLRIKGLEQKAENDAYDLACREGTLDAFKQFLKKYPQGQNAGNAKKRIQDFDLWSAAKQKNTIQSYNSYLQNSMFKTFESEANAAIESIRAVDEWQTLKHTTKLSDVEAYIRKYPSSSKISEARKKEHELKGVQLYQAGNFAEAYNEFNKAGGRSFIADVNKAAYDKCQEHYDFSLLNSYTKEADLRVFMEKYPNSKYCDQASNMLAIKMAKELTMFSGENTYKNVLSYAKDDVTRNQVTLYYEARQREYSDYKKQQRKTQRISDGGIINFGIEFLDLGINPAAYSDTYSDLDYVLYYNMGLSVKIGNYKSPVQFEVGAKPGLVYCTSWSGDYSEDVAEFHLPVYARLKVSFGKGNYSRWYVDGVGYYNVIKDPDLEGDFSVSAGFGLAWRHWDWRMLYYKLDVGPSEAYSNYMFLGTSLIYYF